MPAQPLHLPSRASVARLLTLALLLATLTLTACSPPLTTGQRQDRQRYAELTYPLDLPYGPDPDIVVRRDGHRLTLINRTAQSYRDHRLWLNQQFVRDLPLVRIGPDNMYDLRRWTNQHREPFPVGTLLSPDAAEPVVLAELVNPEGTARLRLLVWPESKQHD